MISIEAFARKGEKNILKNMFKEDGASSDSSMSDCESDSVEAVNTNSSLHSTKTGMQNISNDSAHIGRNVVDEERNMKPSEGSSRYGKRSGDIDEFSNDHASISSSDMNDTESSMELYHSNSKLFTISMLQQKRKGIAHQLWPAATYLSRYLESNLEIACSNRLPENMNILELGAGIGLCGLVCSALKFKKVILTDLPIAQEILQSNIDLNESMNTYAKVLSWGCQDDVINIMNELDRNIPLLIIAADCVYWEILFKPLCDTIKELVMVYNAEVIISHVKRWKKDEKFFKMCRRIMIVELLDEIRELIPAEHTGIPTRVIKRVYRIKAK